MTSCDRQPPWRFHEHFLMGNEETYAKSRGWKIEQFIAIRGALHVLITCPWFESDNVDEAGVFSTWRLSSSKEDWGRFCYDDLVDWEQGQRAWINALLDARSFSSHLTAEDLFMGYALSLPEPGLANGQKMLLEVEKAIAVLRGVRELLLPVPPQGPSSPSPKKILDETLTKCLEIELVNEACCVVDVRS